MPSTKCEVLSYPTHILKTRGSVIRNDFLEHRPEQATLFARRNDIYAWFATIKAKQMLNGHLSGSCSDTIYSKSIKKKKKVPSLKIYHFSISQHFSNVKV